MRFVPLPAALARRPQRRTIVVQMLAVFTLPLVLMAALYFAAAVADYLKIIQYDDWWSRRQTFRRVLGLKLLGAANALRAQELERHLNPTADDPAIIRLDVDRDVWDRMSADPRRMFEQYFDAAILRGNIFHPVKIRFRGDTSVHWLTEKRSFTLRTPQDELFKGHRRLAFSCKSVLEQFVTARMAQQFDLLAPAAYVCPVFLNDRFYGLYRVLELIDESFLRHRGRMPGNLYRGDTAERGEEFKGVERDLFLNPYIWELAEANDRPGAPPADAMREWIVDLNEQDGGARERFLARLDLEELSNLVSLMLLVGDMHHMSGIHNQNWYEDPATGTLHPIPWDLELRDLRDPPHPVNPFLGTVLREPTVMDGALRILARKLADDALPRQAEALTRGTVARFATYFQYDQLRRGSVNHVGDADEVIGLLRSNAACIREWIADARAAVASGGGSDGWQVLDLETRGFAAVELEAIEVQGTLPPDCGLRVLADRNRSGAPDEGDEAVAGAWSSAPGGRFTPERPLRLLAGIDARETRIKPAPLHYRFFVRAEGADGAPAGAADFGLRPVLVNSISGAAVNPEAGPPGAPIAGSVAWHPWDRAAPPATDVRLAGEVELRETLRVAASSRLIIEPGTTIRVHPDVSILARGRVTAVGEAGRPIIFTAVEPGRPWGVVALLGRGADASRFEHCTFEQGGGAVLERIEFKGAVCVHRAAGVVFRDCEFRSNLRCDDLLNAVNAQVDVERCAFRAANADAIDYDCSAGTIRDCTIEGSGNDGIDLMGSAPRIVANRIRGSGDKGVSIGEGSAPLLAGNVIAGCVRGVEVKDGSEPDLIENLIEGARIGVHQYMKNWRYGAGGRAKVIGSLLRRNGRDYECDARSYLAVAEAAPGAPDGGTDAASVADALLAGWGVQRSVQADGGAAAGWRLVAPAPTVVRETYADDFEDATDGWTGPATLRKRDGHLVVDPNGRRVTVRKAVDWVLSEGSGPCAVVFELGGRMLEAARVAVRHEGGVYGRELGPLDDPQHFRLVAVELPAGRCEGVEIEIDPGARQGRLYLHAIQVFGLSGGSP